MSKSITEHTTGDPVLMRRARLAKIHLAKKALALEDESYRALLRRITGKDSAAALAMVELDAVLAEFRRLGFVEKARIRPRKPAPHPHQRKVYALWGALQPYLTDSSARALRSFCRRQVGVETPEFLSPEQANKVTEGLKAWLKRAKAKAEEISA